MTGTVVTRELKDGTKRYDSVWRVNGKQKWKTFKKRKDADRHLTTVVKTVHDGTYQAVEPLSMDALFDRWLTHSLDVRVDTGELKPSTAKSYKSMLKTHLRPAFKDYRSDQLPASAVADWRRARAAEISAETLTPKTFNNLLNLLHSILVWAKHPGQHYLAHDPLIGQRRLKRDRTERDFLEPRDIETLIAAATSDQDKAILHVLCYAGLRRGEAFALQWGDIDAGDGERGGRLAVRRSVYQGDVTTPKTEHSQRLIDVPQRVLDALTRHKATSPPVVGDYIFRTAGGTPIDADNFYKRTFNVIRTGAGLRAFGLHALRHTYASLLIAQGESLKYISKQLGHASIQITADTYGHLFKATSTQAMRRLNKVIPAPESKTTRTAPTTATRTRKGGLRIVA